jgi:hypothetical protein
MRPVLIFLQNWRISLIELALTGAVAATSIGVLVGNVHTFGRLPVWGAWGVLSGVLIGVVMALRAEHPTRRARNNAREVIGLAVTDAECAAALRASVRGPVPDDPKIRWAATRLAVRRHKHALRRSGGMFFFILGGLLFALAVLRTAEDLSNWPSSCAGWGMLAEQVRTWRVRRHVSRLTEIPTAHGCSSGCTQRATS